MRVFQTFHADTKEERLDRPKFYLEKEMYFVSTCDQAFPFFGMWKSAVEQKGKIKFFPTPPKEKKEKKKKKKKRDRPLIVGNFCFRSVRVNLISKQTQVLFKFFAKLMDFLNAIDFTF